METLDDTGDWFCWKGLDLVEGSGFTGCEECSVSSKSTQGASADEELGLEGGEDREEAPQCKADVVEVELLLLFWLIG